MLLSYLFGAEQFPNNNPSVANLTFDRGENWDILSNYGTYYNTKLDTSYTNDSYSLRRLSFGLEFKSENISSYLSGYFSDKNGYFFYIQIPTQVVSNKSHYLFPASHLFEQVKGTFQSRFGFKNDWVTVQIVKGNENWGAGGDISLGLSSDSEIYDYFILGSNYGKIRVKYIHGFLEKRNLNNNRYITARGIEWTNKKSLVIGLSESIIYSGENQGIEIAYINPIGTHLESELNNRSTYVGSGGANAVWQLHFDYLIKNKIRFSLNYLFDEFVMDPEIEIGKEHSKAYAIRLSYTPVKKLKDILTFITSYNSVGIPTFRHVDGNNNFVTNGSPLGSAYGSDHTELKFEINYLKVKSFLLSVFSSSIIDGQNNILRSPYDPYLVSDYQKQSFPSGAIKKNHYINFSSKIWIKNNLTYFLSFYKNSTEEDHGLMMGISSLINFNR